jgi:hypothetical protein
MLYRGAHLLSSRWFQGVGAREVMTSVASVGLAAGIVAGAALAGRAGPEGNLAPTTLTAPAPTVTQTPPSRPPGGPGAPQTTPGVSGPTPTAAGPPAASQAPPTTLGAPAPTVPTTTGATSTTRPCRKVIMHTRPHITVVVCIPIRK